MLKGVYFYDKILGNEDSKKEGAFKIQVRLYHQAVVVFWVLLLVLPTETMDVIVKKVNSSIFHNLSQNSKH